MVLGRDKLFALLREIRRDLEAIYGDRLVGVYLYGSYARGDADVDSDIDVAVVLDGPVNRWDERRRTSELWSEYSLRDNCLITSLFLSREEFQETPFAIHRSIRREGVRV